MVISNLANAAKKGPKRLKHVDRMSSSEEAGTHYSVLPSLDARISCRIKKAVVGVTQLVAAPASQRGMFPGDSPRKSPTPPWTFSAGRNFLNGTYHTLLLE